MQDSYRKLLLCLVVFITNAGWAKDSSGDSDVVLSPKVISSGLSTVTYELVAENIKPFLESVIIVEHSYLRTKKAKPLINKPKIENNTIVIDSPYIEKGQFLNSVKKFFTTKKVYPHPESKKQYVVGFVEKTKVMAGVNDLVFVAGVHQEQYKEYAFIEPGAHLYHPETKEYLGTETLIIGQGTVVTRAKVSSLLIKNAQKSISRGTIIIPNRSIQLPETIEASVPASPVDGYVLRIIGGLQKASSRNVVIVSVGERDGVKVGDLLLVQQSDLEFKDPYKSHTKYKIPALESKGEILLYDVFDKVSAGIIIKSIKDIEILDRVK